MFCFLYSEETDAAYLPLVFLPTFHLLHYEQWWAKQYHLVLCLINFKSKSLMTNEGYFLIKYNDMAHCRVWIKWLWNGRTRNEIVQPQARHFLGISFFHKNLSKFILIQFNTLFFELCTFLSFRMLYFELALFLRMHSC